MRIRKANFENHTWIWAFFRLHTRSFSHMKTCALTARAPQNLKFCKCQSEKLSIFFKIKAQKLKNLSRRFGIKVQISILEGFRDVCLVKRVRIMHNIRTATSSDSCTRCGFLRYRFFDFNFWRFWQVCRKWSFNRLWHTESTRLFKDQ